MCAEDRTAGEPCLVLLEDDEPVRTIAIGRRVQIGRQADNDLVLTDEAASRHHAEVIRDGDTCTLRDLESTNSTLVNGSRIGVHALRDGDRIQIGATVIEFRRS